MQPSVRLAKPADLSGILALYRELRPKDPYLSEPEGKAAFDQVLHDNALSLIVCERGNVLAATCMLAVIQNLASGARPFGVLEHVVTLPEFRRQGLARMVLRYAMELAWSKRCYKVTLLSGADRIEAHRLYESVGFRGDIERGFVAKASYAA
jgi:GNAT superfamily N-acetyltransferase